MIRRRLIVAAALLGVLGAAPAAETGSSPRFHVELIVFARAAGGGEWWPSDPGQPPLDEAQAIPDRGPGADGLRPAATHHLAGVARRLARSNRHRLLAHLAWTQPLPEGRAPAPVAVRGDTMVTASQPARSTEEPDRASSALDVEPDSSVISLRSRRRVPELEGTVSLRHSRYLHAALDLVFRTRDAAPRRPRADTPEAASSDAPRADAAGRGPTRGVRLNQRRRLRVDELHYFDHPLFGALLRIRELQDDGGTE